MSLFEEILEEIKEIETVEDLNETLSPFYDRALDDEAYYNALIETAKYLNRLGYRDFGIIVLETLYEINPIRNVGYQIALAYYQYQYYEQAYEWIEEVYPNKLTFKYAFLKARILDSLNDYNEARDLLIEIIKEFPTQAEPYIVLAKMYEKHGNVDRAEYYLKVAYDYFPKQIDQLAIRKDLVGFEINKEMMDIEKIEKLYENEELEKDDEDYYLLAVAYQKAKQFDTAIEMAQKSIQLNADNFNSHFLLMELYQDTNKASALKKEITWLAKSLPPFDATILRLVEVAINVDEVSIELINKLEDYYLLADDEADQYQIISVIVNYYLQQGDYAHALHQLRTLGDSFEDQSYLSYWYAKTFEALNNKEEADKNYQKAIEYLVNEDNLIVDYANFLINDNRYEEAQQLVKRFEDSIYSSEALKTLSKQIDNYLAE
ncbi:tetratricopeptide repeat protein [Fundicoccus culcitae]|uniref:Tetratricopeptide repeat protein n=1 Tax=Fundicoccus culcitae TaxID=2969821 RepID=A0ABY5P719_9LACT|nr:tetratricopeptide repeat protein [Fundicoccus culcitae]UUX34537.1 tetratricopeptide repeat protein [Fundicoccus culcitae]